MHKFLIVVATIALLVTSSGTALAGGDKKIYDSLEIAPNVPSVGAEAYSWTEFGDEVTFAGSARALQRVTVTLSSWACQSGSWFASNCVTQPGATFDVPITFNIYQPGANNRAGALIATQTKTFSVPYRPSTDAARCTGGRWFDKKSGSCFNGLEWLIKFDFNKQNVTLPETVVYGITYSTTHYGTNPAGEGTACYSTPQGCPYDSLNVGLGAKVNIGAKPFPDTVYQNAVYGGDYCDAGAAGVGIMRLDSPTSACWAGYVPAVRFTAKKADGGATDSADTDSSDDDN